MRAVELTFEEFLESKTTWNDALGRSLDNNVFLTWEWLTTWWKHYGERRTFHLITVRDDEKILAAAPLMRSRYKLYGLELRKIEFIGTPASDYHGFLLTQNKPEYVKMMIEHLGQYADEWDCIELREIPNDSETARVLEIVSGTFRFETRMLDECPYVLLSDKFETFLKRLSLSFQKNLQRYEKKLRKEFKVDFRVLADAEAVEDGMKIFFDLHQKRWQSQKQPGAFSDQRFCDFHLDVARTFAQNGWLTLNFLTLSGEPAAASYDFTYGQKLFYYLSGFDPQYSRYNVGHLRHMFLIKHCIENGLKEYDFMRGNEPYKTKWNTSVRKNLEMRAIKRRIIPMAYNWITKNEKFTSLTNSLGKRLSVK